ncbi:MAG: adenylyltransferase/cytidyltransferase family protein [Lachnospiraceae bacterium]
MVKVITYGTFDLFHYGHLRLLERAKALGDYLIVGVTADDFDKARGKINVQQSLVERIESVRATGLADEIIVEEYEGQKIEDILKYNIDIFTIGSDWKGKFDYLKEYCKVVYLDRTEGISSSEIRSEQRVVNLGLVGNSAFLNKIIKESKYVNGLQICSVLSSNDSIGFESREKSFEDLVEKSDAVYIRSLPEDHYSQIKYALSQGRHVLCESPVTLSKKETKELMELAENQNLILMEALKTAYATAFERLLLMIKSGKIGDVISIDSTCTSLKKDQTDWSGLYEWAPTALLPILEILGDKFEKRVISHNVNGEDVFTKIDLLFDHATAEIKVGNGVKSEGELIISGTKGYVYVPAPWWKTDYFEVRYENPEDNKRYFYQLDGEGIRYELVCFVRAVKFGKYIPLINKTTTYAISEIMEYCNNPANIINI